MAQNDNRPIVTVMNELDARAGVAEAELAKPIVYFTSAALSVTEGNSGTKDLLVEGRRSSLSGTLNVTAVFNPGSSSPDDFGGNAYPGDKVLAFPDGSDTASFKVPIAGNVSVEPNDTFSFTIAANAAYRRGATSTVTGTIINDDSSSANEPTTSGLMLRDAGTLDGWNYDATSWSSIAAPATVASPRSPIVAQAPSASGSEAGGIREGFLFEDTDGVWYIFYGAGNGSVSDAGGPWRPQYSRSTDRGLNWTKMGQLNPGLSKGYDQTNWAAIDMLFLDKRGNEYLLHRLTAGTVSNNQVCGQPYTSDIWSAPAPGGPYTYVGRSLESGAQNAPDGRDAYASCMVLNNGVYHLFYSSTSGDGDYNCGLATSNSPKGPFTKVNAALIPSAFKMQPENPEVYFDSRLNKWVMLVNQVNKTKFVTDRNRAFYSDSLTDWSQATFNELQLIVPADGKDAIGMGRIKRNPDNNPVFDNLGNYGIIFDADPKPGFGLHTGRSLFYSQHEPSPFGMLVRDNVDFSSFNVADLGGQQGWVDRSGTNAKPRVVASGNTRVLDMRASVGASAASRSTVIVPARNARYVGTGMIGNNSGFGFGFGYKVGEAHMRVDIGRGTDDLGFTPIYVNAAGAETNLTTVKVGIGSATTDFDYDISLNGNTFIVRINGIQRLSYEMTDAAHIAAASKDGDVFVRNGFGGNGERIIRSLAVMAASGTVVSTTRPLTMRSLAHTRLSAEFGLLLNIGAIAFIYRSQSAANADNAYAIVFSIDNTGKLVVTGYKMVGGVVTQTGAGVGTLLPETRAYLRAQIIIDGTSHKVVVDGQTQVEFDDGQFSSGTGIGFRAASGSASAELRNVTFRQSNVVTVNGLTVGDKVTLRGASGIPLLTQTAGGGTMSLTFAHFPATAIEVNGTVRHAPVGGVWGGDIYG